MRYVAVYWRSGIILRTLLYVFGKFIATQQADQLQRFVKSG
jgi:hypothetical protein